MALDPYDYDERDIKKFHSKKKNTKKWCKGIEGRKHEPTMSVKNAGSKWWYSIWLCANCGKHLSYRWSSQW